MLEDGTWEKPHRPRKSGEHISIDQVSAEDLHPDVHPGPQNPEETLIAKQELLESETLEPESAEYSERQNSGIGPHVDEETYPWEEKESRAEYEKQLKAAIERYMAKEEGESHPPIRKGGIKSSGSSRSAQGRRGKEPRYKNKKGRPTIRRPGGGLEA